MKRKLLGVLLVAQLLLAPTASAAQSQFSGTWLSTDTDGSTQLLMVGAGAAPAVTYLDFYASSCVNAGSHSAQFVAAGKGLVDGDVLVVDFHKTGCGPFGTGGFTISWTLVDGTLVDDFGIVWYPAT